ncbi:M48 family metalloprotease [Streptomyces malaysiense]|uniref:Peptidase M48 domain-containing protein n=1 Tax=Streptomyces malaysiense TaxID=1428626 RepID=A0A1J4PS25_9ACTN|nr:M48 family metallopeptidase [Streptomyces malaysiense]OIK23124.1 hypothetical protein VT52_034335 [Streptomyces malaysiense]
MTTALSDETTTAEPCPACGSALTSDPRFTQWCQTCKWNAYPAATKARKRGDRFQRKLNRAAEERLYRRITQGGAELRSLDGSWIAAFALSGVVHLVTVALIGVGIALLTVPTWPLRLLGGFLLALAYLLRPRFGPSRKARRRMRVVNRDDAPSLYALSTRVAAELGTDPPSMIVVDGRYNASYRRIGLRRRPVLTLGLPLWETLSPVQRLALIGHELGHGANGDVRRSMWVGTALRSLEEWYHLFRPGSTRRRHLYAHRNRGGGAAHGAEMITAVLLGVFAELTLLAHWLLSRLTAMSGRRAEYLADEMAARLAGREATADLLRALTVANAVSLVRQKRRLATGTGRGAAVGQASSADLWTDLRAYVDSIPDSERTRRLLVSELDDSAVDTTHPPTHLRLAFVRQLPPTEPAIVLAATEMAAVDEELAFLRAAVAEQLSS